MASKVDIWNTALSHIGHKAVIADPDERSAEANHCRRFYPIALGVTIERFAWSFATRRAALAEVDNALPQMWAFAYALPNLCVAPRAVLMAAGGDDDPQDYTIESDDDGNLVLYTNAEDAVLKYSVLVEDTTKFTPYFVLALSYDLAGLLVGPIPKDLKLKDAMTKQAEYWTSMAEASNANSSQQSSAYKEFVPEFLRR